MSNEARYKLVAQDRGQRAFRSFRKGLGGIDKMIGGALMPQLAAVAGVAGFGAMVKGSLDAADKIHKLNLRLGVSTEALSEYKHVANLSGVEFDKMTTGIQRMTRRIAEAAKGTGPARDALDELGLSAQDLAQLQADQQFEAIADAMQGVTNEGDRVRLAMKLFDSEGVSLVQTMGDGAEGIRAMREEAKRLGLSLSQDAADKAAKAKDAMARLDAAGKGLVQEIAVNLGPAIATLADWLADKIPKAVQWTSSAFHAMRKAAGIAVYETINAYADLLDALGKLPDALGGEEFRKEADRYRYYAAQASGWGDAVEVASGQVEDFKMKTGEAADVVDDYTKTLWEETIPAYQAMKEHLDAVNGAIEVQADMIREMPKRWATLGDGAYTALDAISAGIVDLNRRTSDWLTTLVMDGSSAAGKFKAVWMGAIRAVVNRLAELAVQKAVFRGLDFVFPGVGTLLEAAVTSGGGSGSPLGRSASVAGGGGASPAAPSQVVFVNQALTPDTAVDRLNSYRRVNDLTLQAAPYLMAEG